jgi:hypothetical protein
MSNQEIQDSVYIELSAEEAIVSDTVKVSVEVVLATKAEDATDVRGTILGSLKTLLDADWAFAKLDRTTNRSGLEEVEATATVRVAEGQLAGLAAKAKDASREGLQLKIGDLDYNPARNVVDEAVANLRKELYIKAQDEALLLNQVLGAGSAYEWRVGTIQFGSAPRMKMANSRGIMLESASYAVAASADMGGASSLDLTQKVGLTASVTLLRLVK